MPNIRVRTSTNNVSVRVGQENAIRVLSSAAGGGQFAELSNSVIGGIASVTSLSVSGISTLYSLEVTDTIQVNGSSIFNSNVSIGANLTVNNNLTIGNDILYPQGSIYGISYFDESDVLRSTESSSNPSLTNTNLILTTNGSGVPAWSNSIDGGTY